MADGTDLALERPARHRPKGPGWVYFVAAPDVGRLKIGLTFNLMGRLTQLRAASPVTLGFLGVAHSESPGPLEADLHRAFRRYRLHGEWFEWVEPMEAWIREYGIIGDDLVELLDPDARPAGWRPPHRLPRVPQALFEAADVADAQA